MAQTLMVLRTASGVGKSLLVTGLCRLFSRAGIRVAPFKALNMSNNAYVCFPTGEIGLVGTMELLEVSERERAKGFIINKFRGELSILEPGLRMLEERTGKPVLGVLPDVPGLALEAEYSVSLETYYKQPPPFSPSRVNIAVVTLPCIANFTDFLPLSNIDSVALNYVHTPNEIVNADVVILPGSKNTIADLRWLKAGHWARPLRQLEEHGKGSWVYAPGIKY